MQSKSIVQIKGQITSLQNNTAKIDKGIKNTTLFIKNKGWKKKK